MIRNLGIPSTANTHTQANTHTPNTHICHSKDTVLFHQMGSPCLQLGLHCQLQSSFLIPSFRSFSVPHRKMCFSCRWQWEPDICRLTLLLKNVIRGGDTNGNLMERCHTKQLVCLSPLSILLICLRLHAFRIKKRMDQRMSSLSTLKVLLPTYGIISH